MTDGTTSGTSVLSHADAEALRGTAKWARFLAIVNFVFLGLMLLFGIFAGSMMSKMGSMAGAAQEAQMEQMRELQEQMQGSGMEGMEDVDLEAIQGMQGGMNSGAMAMAGTMYTIVILIAVAIAFFPTLLLFQFGTRTLKALDGSGDAAILTAGLNAHRRYYKFAGIIMIIALSFMALGLLFGGLGAMMM